MKKQLLFLFLILFSMGVTAQNNNKEEYKLSSIVSAGIGYGGAWWLTGGIGSNGNSGTSTYSIVDKKKTSPTISVGYEYVLKKKLGIGYLGAGARFCYQSAVWTETTQSSSYNSVWKWRWNIYDLSLRATYHFILPNKPKIEPYAGLSPSYVIWKMKYTFDSPYYNSYSEESYHIPEVLSVFGGVRFRVLKLISLFGELGYPYSWATIGANLQF